MSFFNSRIYYWSCFLINYRSRRPGPWSYQDTSRQRRLLPLAQPCYTLTATDSNLDTSRPRTRTPASVSWQSRLPPHGESRRFLPGADLGAEGFAGGGREARRLEGPTRRDHCYSAQAPGTRSPFLALSRSQPSVTCVTSCPQREREKKREKRTRPHTEDGLSLPLLPLPLLPQPTASSQEYFLVIRAERIVRFLSRASLQRRRWGTSLFPHRSATVCTQLFQKAHENTPAALQNNNCSFCSALIAILGVLFFSFWPWNESDKMVSVCVCVYVCTRVCVWVRDCLLSLD